MAPHSTKKLSFAAAALVLTLILTLITLNRLYGTNQYIPRISANTASNSVSTDLPKTNTNLDLVLSTTKKLAAIVETRPLNTLVPILLHFRSILGPDWPIHIFTTEKVNITVLSQSLPFRRGVDHGRFHVQLLPEDLDLNTHASISRFFTQPWFWETTAPAEHVLLFQADSILCSNSPQDINEFLEYDFIGAPIDSSRGLGFGWNGGLSIRNRAMCLDIVKARSWEEERHGDHEHGNVDYEDQWFAKAMRELPPRADGRPGANLPSQEVAMRFSVETMWYDKPLGFHQATVWQAGRMEEIYQWCPEYRICAVETFKDHNPDP